MTRSPVLFLSFNRLDTTARVFEAIRVAQPPRLYLASDGPRESRLSESDQVNRVRQFMTSHIDWPCEVKLLFRQSNLGCKLAVSQAITWFFEHEESGIILEDDCLPHPDFFRFCDEMLEYYKDDESIFSISGTNIQKATATESSYIFSSLGGIWGWASWRRAWSQYTLDVHPNFNSANWSKISSHIGNISTAKAMRFIMKSSLIDAIPTTWDYQWVFAILLSKGKCIIPANNLISNIGFGVESTHTFDPNNPLSNLECIPLTWPMIHPKTSSIDTNFDQLISSYSNSGVTARAKSAAKHFFQFFSKALRR